MARLPGRPNRATTSKEVSQESNTWATLPGDAALRGRQVVRQVPERAPHRVQDPFRTSGIGCQQVSLIELDAFTWVLPSASTHISMVRKVWVPVPVQT